MPFVKHMSIIHETFTKITVKLDKLKCSLLLFKFKIHCIKCMGVFRNCFSHILTDQMVWL